MNARSVLVLLVLGGHAGAGTACSSSLAPGATDARVKADSMCQYDVDAMPASVDGGGDPCTFLIAYPTDPALPVDAFRIIVDGVTLLPDPTNGWSYTDVTQRVVKIAGPTCDAIKAGTIHTIWVEFYCSGIL